MIKRSIILLPKPNHSRQLNDIRKSYDPLYGKIEPHITLVFPFESKLSVKELRRHVISAITHIKPFTLTLEDAVAYENKYLFLLVDKGKETVTKLHDKLYTGPLEEFLRLDLPYIPHMTLGSFDRKEHLLEALSKAKTLPLFETRIRSVFVERIGDDDISHIDFDVPLIP